MLGLLYILPLLATGAYSVGDEEPLLLRHGIPPAEAPETRSAPEWDIIIQRVDHFNPSDNRTWEMRYIRNTEFFQEGSPIFIFIGGEWAISTGWVQSGNFYDTARLHNAILFYTEHRFYGNSYPIFNLQSDSLRYLSADQALADLVYFIEYQKQNTPGLRNSTVVVAGSSYAGTLATWARIKYPHTIDIAYSSSGPLEAIADFTGYYEVVEENLRLASPTCPGILRRAFAEVIETIRTPEGAANISEIFNTCYILNGTAEPERSYFLSGLATPFASAAQYAQPGALVTLCNTLEGLPGSDVEKLAGYIVSSTSCRASYDSFIQYYSNTEIVGSSVTRQWYYQTCTEYGWYQTQAFGDTYRVDLYYNICRDLYGEGFGTSTLNTGVERTNLFYGAVQPEVTRLITCHGTGDPWYRAGLVNDLNENAITIVVPGTSHSADLYSIRSTDSEEMVQAKNRIMNTLSAWIAEIEGTEDTTTTTTAPTTSSSSIITTTDSSNGSFAMSNVPSIFSFLGILFILSNYILDNSRT